MSSEILINVRPNETRVAYIESGTLSDLKIERTTSPTLVGSIHRGKVIRVLPGMQAAFVDIGLDRAAFLYVGDVRKNLDSPDLFLEEEPIEKDSDDLSVDEKTPDEVENKPTIQDLLREGQTIMVQVAKDPLGTKGARITTHISLPGRHIVYMPTLEHLGISRRIEDASERDRLKNIVEKIKPAGGVIVRTAGEGASQASLQEDFDYLTRLWKEVQKSYEKRKSPGQIHAELDVELRALRDLLKENVKQVIVDDSKAYKKIQTFIAQFMPSFKSSIVHYDKAEPLFDLYDLDLEISRCLNRKNWLKSGGYIVIDEAEALVVIDVNTGRFVGKKDLEDTILKNNLEAIREISYQLKIRNVGGIIIIDFIDMEKQAHREKVLNALREELMKDRAKTTIVSMSALGLVEMTRKRIRPSLVSTLCKPCDYCDGRGYIKTKMTVAHEIFRSLEREGLMNPSKPAFVVHCHSEIADWAYEGATESLEFLEKKLGRSVVFKVEPHFHLEQYEIRTL
jgi:ribonuclease G